MHMCNWIIMLCGGDQHDIVNQLYFNFFKKLFREFPGSPVVRIRCFHSLVRELRAQAHCGQVFIYLFLALLGLSCCLQAFSSWANGGRSLVAEQKL